MDKQDAFFSGESESSGGEEDPATVDNAGGNDIIKQVNDIINGKAEHFDVNEASGGHED